MNLLNNLQFIHHPLNQKHKIDAIIRFLRWQIGSRIVPGEIVYHWINGTKFIVRPGETGLTGNIYSGLHEFADMAYVLHVLNPDELFIDIGANVGSYTILACGAKKAYGYCFEPVPSTFERLLGNIRINHLTDRVVALNIGLSDREGELTFTDNEDTTNHVIIDDSCTDNIIKVKVSTLDRIIQDRHPQLIKIDVEGFETLVIDGATETLRDPSLHSVIMELNGSGDRYGFRDEDILQKMNDFGFKAYTYEPFSRAITLLDRVINSTGNTLFIRNLDFVKERVEKSPKVFIGSMTL
jgi:FkbM family methyltransferase